MSEQIFNNLQASVTNLIGHPDSHFGFLANELITKLMPINQELRIEATPTETGNRMLVQIDFTVYDDDCDKAGPIEESATLMSTVEFYTSEAAFARFLGQVEEALQPLLLQEGGGQVRPWLEVVRGRGHLPLDYSYSSFGVAQYEGRDDPEDQYGEQDYVTDAEEFAIEQSLLRASTTH